MLSGHHPLPALPYSPWQECVDSGQLAEQGGWDFKIGQYFHNCLFQAHSWSYQEGVMLLVSQNLKRSELSDSFYKGITSFH